MLDVSGERAWIEHPAAVQGSVATNQIQSS